MDWQRSKSVFYMKCSSH